MRKFYLLLILCMSCTVVLAQPWSYDFGTGTGSFNTTGGASTSFFSSTPSGGGTYRIRAATSGNQGSGFTLANPGTTLGAGTELQINASANTSTNKFGVYDWTSPSTVAYVKFKLRTTSSGNGAVAIVVGTNTVATDNNGYTNQYSNGLSVMSIVYASGSISSISRRNGTTNTAIAGSGLSKDVNQYLEIYANNSASSIIYSKGGISYTLSSQQWDLWIDESKISPTNGWPRSATSGGVSIVAGTNLSGFGVFSESSTSNAATAYVDDLEYSNLLPIQFYSKSTGALNDLATWGLNTDGSGTAPSNFTANSQTFRILNNATPTINANWTVSGNSSQVILGDGTTDISFEVPTNTTFQLGTGATMIINPKATITANATLPVGVIDFNGKSVTIKSTSAGTGRIGQIVTGSLINASNVTVERFIPTVKRAWRLLSSPVSGTTINAAWQEGGSNNTDPNPGYGTHITGGVIGDGYDLSSTNTASLKTWAQASNSWTNYTAATTAGDITDHKGYILFIRGHRGLNITGTQPAATTTTLRATGTLRQGDMAAYVTTGAAATDYTIMGNPYASPIDLGLLNADHAAIETFYSWDPNLAGTNGVGGYVLIQKNGANWDYTPQAGSLQTNNNARFLPSGAAIFVKSPGSAVAITMKESYKVADNTNLTYFRTGNAPTNLAINLNNSASETIDGIRVKFDDSYSNMVTAEDANKLNNEGENIAIRRNGMSLIVEKRQPVTQDDTLFIRLSGMQQNTAYELKFFPNDFTGINAFVEDTYLNTSTPLSLTGITTLNFSTDANVASVGDRFRLVFRPSSVLPVTFTAIRAQEKNGDVLLQWDVTNEVNTLSYVVERSKDGRTFNTVATVAATAMVVGEKHYQWLDVNASKGANFYRVKSVQNSNESKYTSVVKITLGDVMGDINIYPNPVKNGRLSVQLNDLAEGTYEMRILNASGQVIINRKLQHAGGSSVEEIILPAGSAKGIYRLQMLGTDSRITKTIVVE